MGEFELMVDPEKETWKICVRGERCYRGIGDPFRDKIFSTLLDDLCDKESVISLHGAFQRYGFNLRPVMFQDHTDGCAPITGSNDFVQQKISNVLQKLVDEYCTKEK